MSDIAIKAENLSKRYRIGLKEEMHDTFTGAITSWIKSPFANYRRLRKLSHFDDMQPQIRDHGQQTTDLAVSHSRQSTDGSASSVVRRPQSVAPRPSSVVPSDDPSDVIWALRDVSFEVKQGEVLGIIGRNGAGKSTLLKILSRITEPTSGRAGINGRVSSLLEVGTGFHPELTGRENIYLNGTVLGMTKLEIDRKFDEIVDFAEVEKFIDTPVKRYSSGMQVRLAFAVAAHLEPEILLVDEVLAVGDMAFQKKCLGKMGEVSKEGRTVLFVSHNMAAVQSLCERGLLLDEGKVVSDGLTGPVVMKYLSLIQDKTRFPLSARLDRKGSGALRFKHFYAMSQPRGVSNTVCTGEDVTFVAEYESDKSKPLRNVTVSMPFYNHAGQHMFMCWTRMTGQDFVQIPSNGQFRAHVGKLPLMPGRYTVNLWCEANGIVADWVQEAAVINVVEGDFFGSGRIAPSGHGGLVVEHYWTCRGACEEKSQ